MKFKNLFLHLRLVSKHRRQVLKNCRKCGIFWRGFVHDLSKFSPTELFESAKYYLGTRSPIGVCRWTIGVSHAWLHHKGRNKHHIEYWLDQDCQVTPMMPYKYAVECVCDKIAATKIYAKDSYTVDMPYLHWKKYGCKVDGNPKTMAFIEKVFLDLIDLGEKEVLTRAYMQKTYKEICLDEACE